MAENVVIAQRVVRVALDRPGPMNIWALGLACLAMMAAACGEEEREDAAETGSRAQVVGEPCVEPSAPCVEQAVCIQGRNDAEPICHERCPLDRNTCPDGMVCTSLDPEDDGLGACDEPG